MIATHTHHKRLQSNAGFTLIEILVALGIVLILFGVSTFNLISTQHAITIDTAESALVSDMKTQQLNAMVGNGQQTSGSFGIYFMPSQYILFEGTTYSSNNPSNFTITLDPSITIASTTFPNNTLIFNQISGEMSGYTQSNNSVILKNVNDTKQRTITLNRYGVVIQAN